MQIRMKQIALLSSHKYLVDERLRHGRFTK